MPMSPRLLTILTWVTWLAAVASAMWLVAEGMLA